MNLLRPLLALSTFAFSALAADAPGEASEKDWKIHVELTAIVLPEKMLLPLLADLGDATKVEAVFAKLKASVGSNGVSLAGSQVLHTEHGKRAVSENVEEVRYPTEFGSPAYPDLASKKEIASLPNVAQPIVFTPTGFETRNAGVTLEIEPSVSANGGLIQLQARPQHVRLIAWDEFAAAVTPQGAKATVRQPRFYTARSIGQFVLRSGERVFVDSYKWPDQPNMWELFFIKAWTTRQPAAEGAGK